jgi:hypothetical protein
MYSLQTEAAHEDVCLCGRRKAPESVARMRVSRGEAASYACAGGSPRGSDRSSERAKLERLVTASETGRASSFIGKQEGWT